MKTKKFFSIMMTLPVAVLLACSAETTLAPADENADAVPASSSTILPASSAVLIESSSSAVVPTSYAYYGAELSGRDQFLYGRFEARMKMVSIPGSVSSMFLYYDDSWMKKEYVWNEIDIEVLGKGGTSWQSNIITREGDPSIRSNTSSEVIHPFEFDATQDFHLYAIVWTPEYVSWEIDSVEVRRDTLGIERGTHADKDQVAFLTEKQSLRFNLWASKSAAWTGKWAGGVGLPIEQQIDYVRVYSYDAATKGFTMLWQDNFDGEDLDPQHWARGDWEMERVMLRQDNVIVENGVCRLIMDYEAEPK